MTRILTWYDVLGVLPDAPQDDIREAWQARKTALPRAPGRCPAGGPVGRGSARQAVDEAWRVLADPAARESYDEAIGFERPGEGLPPPWRGPSGPDVSLGRDGRRRMRKRWSRMSDPPSRVMVPDVSGLFYQACMDVAGRIGLHVAPVQLTPHPMPVEGLAVGQAPAPGERVHRNSTLTVQVWHPSSRPPLDTQGS